MKRIKKIYTLEELVKCPVCDQCDGTGKIWVGRHWYGSGWQTKCTYCDGLGKLTWETKVT
jgi:DnaJ-class molecular chaperone